MHVVILKTLYFRDEVVGFQRHHLDDAKSVTVGELGRGVMPKTVSSLAQPPELGLSVVSGTGSIHARFGALGNTDVSCPDSSHRAAQALSAPSHAIFRSASPECCGPSVCNGPCFRQIQSFGSRYPGRCSYTRSSRRFYYPDKVI